MPKRDSTSAASLTVTGCKECGWDTPVRPVDPPHDRHHLMAEIIRLQVHNQPPTRSQLEAWVRVDEAFIVWLEDRRRRQIRERDDVSANLEKELSDARDHIDDLLADIRTLERERQQ